MQVWNHDRTISHCIRRYNRMHLSGNRPQLPIIASLGQDNVKAIKNQKRKPDWVWLSVPHLNKTLQRKKEKKTLNHQLPLLQWTPPAAAHNTVRLWQFSHHPPADAVWSARPRHDRRQQTSCFMGTSTLHFVSEEKRRTGGVRTHPRPLPETCTEKMSDALCIVGSVFGESRPTCVWQRP